MALLFALRYVLYQGVDIINMDSILLVLLWSNCYWALIRYFEGTRVVVLTAQSYSN